METAEVVIMVNTENSPHFFIDLKNLVVQFSKYEIAYRAWSQLKLKDDKIDMLDVMMQEQSRQLNEQTRQLNEQSKQINYLLWISPSSNPIVD